jgi:hypothetical protein
MADFWIAEPFVALMMEAARTSETPVNFCRTTGRCNPEVSHLHTRRSVNLTTYLEFISALTARSERYTEEKK